MPCNYLKKLCKSGCDNYNCRAFFPERQPMIMKRDLPLCMSEDYRECPQWEAGTKRREERRLEKLDLHCPFASNNRCDHPEIWTCKGSAPPFVFYPSYLEETRFQRWKRKIFTVFHLMTPVETHKGKPIEFSTEVLKGSCWSGDKKVYVECPYFKQGLVQYNKTVDAIFKSNETE